jgi:hypothetical protein
MRQGLTEALVELFLAENRFPDKSPEDLAASSIERFTLNDLVPQGSTVHCALSFGSVLLLSDGVLEVKYGGFSGKVKGSQIVSFRDIRGVRVKKMGNTFEDTYTVTIDRDDPSQSNFGFKNIPFIMGTTASQAHAQVFQGRLSQLMNGNSIPTSSTATESPLDQLSKLKTLLDAGAISQDEFDSAKAKLMDQI